MSLLLNVLVLILAPKRKIREKQSERVGCLALNFLVVTSDGEGVSNHGEKCINNYCPRICLHLCDQKLQ